MSNGWKKVALLGKGGGYPHLLADSHGWCLKLGPSARQDEKYYTRFPNLLGGLIEHLMRRRLGSTGAVEGLEELAAAVRSTLREAGEMCLDASKTIMHEPIRSSPGAMGLESVHPTNRSGERSESPDMQSLLDH